MITITDIRVTAVAAPPTGFGGDPRNIAQGGPTYANVYLQVFTSDPDLVGSSIIFTNGRGLKEQCQLTEQLARHFLLDPTLDVSQLHQDFNFATIVQKMLQDPDYAWLGSVGMSRMAIGAVINALWDLFSRQQQLPAWHALLNLGPEQLVALIDFEPIADVLSPDEALAMLQEAQTGLAERCDDIYAQGLLAYNTAGWSGIAIDTLCEQVQSLCERGWPMVKVKVGAGFAQARLQAVDERQWLTRAQLDALAERSAAEDIERLNAVFSTIEQNDRRASKMTVAVDSNQIFDPQSAIVFIRHLARGLYAINPTYQIQWFEEPTNPHSALGHIQIEQALQRDFDDLNPPLRAPVSTGEQASCPSVFKDLLFAYTDPAQGSASLPVLQMDYCRVAGIADNLAILLLAQKARNNGHRVRICPHAGGIGLCEGVRHVQAIKQALFGKDNGNGQLDILEFVEEPTRSVHEGIFTQPAQVVNGHYQMCTAPGVGVDYTEAGLAQYQLPGGSAWQSESLQPLARQISP
ncbi:enolase C-terminal domain-like protein [Gilvimarinus xylanilyticus]|uniref:Enolase C-terminal domain-containing protein n=1 Tax=Gilvimarinus xylanilyticus TaxID=2944139 RepID=A0A9X2HZR0_9GAMM|nr:enolase C-terminal domain-like protein [Gilvimarinus xylanilyticus]MCP8900084.1 hypothetical protein [Gilvimarinus xylanilyticus]